MHGFAGVKLYRRCPGIATITGHSQPVTQRRRTHYDRQYTSRKKNKQEKLFNQAPLPQQSDHSSRQDQPNTTGQRTGQNMKKKLILIKSPVVCLLTILRQFH